MNPFDHKKIEKKWQDRWEADGSFVVKEDSNKKKSYFLIEFPYPSGEGLHVGHPRSYTAMDVLARKRRMQGENVLFPIGFDAFGLPTENYAIKTGRQPAEITKENCDNFRRQLKSLGYSFDWSREIKTTDPAYYKWTQWIFLQMFKKGLAYKAKVPINWCLSCKIGLAHEEVVNGKCERCGGEVEQREKEQWMLKITEYAGRLIDDLKMVDYLPRIKTQQINWIGRSEGYEVDFAIRHTPYAIRIFTTRLDTIFGATYMVVAPEHEIVEQLKDQIANWDEVDNYVKAAKKKTELERKSEEKEKTGVKLEGVEVINPASGENIPVFVADYVLMGYGTGAIMAVPVHDARDYEFAKKFNLKIKGVIVPKSPFRNMSEPNVIELQNRIRDGKEVFTGKGQLQESGEFTLMSSDEAIPLMAQKFGAQKKVQYKLRDWVFSRQRYWGEPIPITYCRKCWETQNPELKTQKEGIDYILINGKEHAIVPVPENQLPVILPEIENYQPTDTGESPLAAITDWVNTTCPKCGGDAERETDTMPNWAGSSWYFLRYTDPRNDKEFASREALEYWTPVDWYNGGMEHTTLHLLYSRFWHKFLFNIGVVPTLEPYAKRTSHGMILGEGGVKMSKSKGNVINPDDIVATYGADTMRTYELFIGPFADAIPWSNESIAGVRRFLDRVYYIMKESTNDNAKSASIEEEKKLRHIAAKTIKKVGEDIEAFAFNTAISAMMELVNHLYAIRDIAMDKADALRNLLLILQPFAPHLTAELWEGDKPIWKEDWPTYDENDLVEDTITIAVQINGKLRGTISAPSGTSENEAVDLAKASINVMKWLKDKEIIKQIYVQDKLLNFVVK